MRTQQRDRRAIEADQGNGGHGQSEIRTDSTLRLRRIAVEDRDGLFEVLKDFRVTEWFPGWGYRADADVSARAWVDAHLHPDRHVSWLDRVIVDGRSDDILGSISLSLATGSLSYWIAPDRQGRGYATFAVRTLSDDVFSRQLLETIWAEVERNNLPSQRVLIRTGFSFTGLDVRRTGNRVCTLSRFERRAHTRAT